MSETGAPTSGGVVRFVIVSNARTGSTMLVDALNSHPRVRCFREIFNRLRPEIDYAVPGYDGTNRDHINQRYLDPAAFLRAQVYGPEAATMDAIGFKVHYGHFEGFPKLLGVLQEDTGIRVIHLVRRNALRALVSLRLAETTGEWARFRRTEMTVGGAVRSGRRRLRAAAVRFGLRKGSAPSVRLSPEECVSYFEETSSLAAEYAASFASHTVLNVTYEELLEMRDVVFEATLDFLGVERAPLQTTLERQRPEPLRVLIENYDEIAATLRGTAYAEFLEDRSG